MRGSSISKTSKSCVCQDCRAMCAIVGGMHRRAVLAIASQENPAILKYNLRCLDRSMRTGCMLCKLFWDTLRANDRRNLREYRAEWPIWWYLYFNRPRGDVVGSLGISYGPPSWEDGAASLLFPVKTNFQLLSHFDAPQLLKEIIPYTVVPIDPLTRYSMEKVNFWLTTCIKSHKECKSNNQVRLPTRVIHVGRSHDTSPHLTISSGRRGRYLALSHCWGDRPSVTLTSATLPDMLRSLPLASLPQSFRDAIIFTRELGHHYLWIDSLCIIQDDPDDWKREAATMSEVYGNAQLTIAATSSTGSHIGLFQHKARRVGSIWARRCHATQDSKSDLYLSCRKHLVDLDPSGHNHLATRGWCLQEQILSARMLHFTDRQLVFECNVDMWWESGESETRLPKYMQLDSLGHHLKRSTMGDGRTWRDQYCEGLSPHLRWTYLIENYSGRQLSKETDKLSAIAGLAQAFAPLLGNDYVAGLWKRELAQSLLWMPYKDCVYPKEGCIDLKSPLEWRAPSWSWSSLDGKVIFGGYQASDQDVTIVDAKVTPAGEDRFGQVTAGSLKIRGCLARIWFDCIRKERLEDGCYHLDTGASYRLNQKILFDAGQIPPRSELFCLRFKRVGSRYSVSNRGEGAHGLILDHVEHDNTYKRVGVFWFTTVGDGWPEGHMKSWFPPYAERQTITIV